MGRHISSEARSCNCGRRIAGPAVRLARGDAGLGLPSYACQVMEWGFDGVLVNTAVSRAIDPVTMATAFASATKAGRDI
jgi:pyridoxal biosynthesis lyase PdxS